MWQRGFALSKRGEAPLPHQGEVLDKMPGPAGMHHPQIGVWRTDHIKRHPKVSPLSPTVAPAVLHKRQLFRKVVTEAKHFVASLLTFARFRKWHDARVRHLLRHERLADCESDQNRPGRWVSQTTEKVGQTSDAVISASLVLKRVLRLLRRRRGELARDIGIKRR